MKTKMFSWAFVALLLCYFSSAWGQVSTSPPAPDLTKVDTAELVKALKGRLAIGSIQQGDLADLAPPLPPAKTIDQFDNDEFVADLDRRVKAGLDPATFARLVPPPDKAAHFTAVLAAVNDDEYSERDLQQLASAIKAKLPKPAPKVTVAKIASTGKFPEPIETIVAGAKHLNEVERSSEAITFRENKKTGVVTVAVILPKKHVPKGGHVWGRWRDFGEHFSPEIYGQKGSNSWPIYLDVFYQFNEEGAARFVKKHGWTSLQKEDWQVPVYVTKDTQEIAAIKAYVAEAQKHKE